MDLHISTTLIRILLVIVGFALVGIIMLQQSKDGGGMSGLGGAGGGASGSVFGSKGASSSFFKITAGLAVSFALLVVLSVYLSNKDSNASRTLQEIEKQAEEAKIPVLKNDNNTDSATNPSIESSIPVLKTEPTTESSSDNSSKTDSSSNNTNDDSSTGPVTETTITDLPSSKSEESVKSIDSNTTTK